MDALSASTGDVVEIKGKRKTVAKCLPLYPSDEGKGIIRVDGLAFLEANLFFQRGLQVIGSPFELTHGFSDRSPDVRKPFRPEDDQGHKKNHEELGEPQ